jgi:hypothetical protein
MAAMTADGTVEWGEDRPIGWLDRLLGEPDSAGRRRISGVALGCAVAAVVLLLGSTLVPWMTATSTQSETGIQAGDTRDLYLEDVAFWQAGFYYVGWLVLLAFVGTSLVATEQIRRLVVAAGLGCSGAMLAMVAANIRQINTGTILSDVIRDSGFGPGALLGLIAVLAAAAAMVLSGWQRGASVRRRSAPRPDDEPEVDPGPADLTVTPLE